MTNAIRQTVTVKEEGIIEIRSPELVPGRVAEVIVLLEPEANGDRAARVSALAALLRETQGLKQARAITEEEIAAEVAAHRAARR